ncbi:DUF2149 domain-containing protein [Azohydromonas aeria]|uniref:DUF2149 domain-containing protein n=1 Tax=Azohydromonas aeria TaxID=2590212 RepID=UPI0012FB4113|nr:DUF2149 domain-containing protein [Azohydromonas aeria]
MRPGRGPDLLGEDDDDPMLSAVNLVDVFLVLVVALLTAVAAQGARSSAAQATPVTRAGEADMELVVHDDGQAVRFKGSGSAGAAEGSERAGVAYRLKDGSIVYVPEAAGAAAQPAR